MRQPNVPLRRSLQRWQIVATHGSLSAMPCNATTGTACPQHYRETTSAAAKRFERVIRNVLCPAS